MTEDLRALPPIETFKLGSRYYFARLSQGDRVWYRQIYDAWLTGATHVELEMPGTGFVTPEGTPFRELVLAVVEDNPHLFHVERSHFHYRRTGERVSITSSSIYTPRQFQQTYEQLRRRVSTILAAARKYPDELSRVRFVHDYLAASITYDPCEDDPVLSRQAHTVAGALLNRRCVCDGYARAFRLLCDRLGISCIVVVGRGPMDGSGEGHAWNMVKLDSVPYHVDVTWDSMNTDGRLVKDFEFLRCDGAAARRHAWDRAKYPACPADHPRREPVLDSPEDLEAELVAHLQARHHGFMLRLGPTLAQPGVFAARLEPLLDRHSRLCPKKGTLVYYFYEKYAYVEFEYIKTAQGGGQTP